MNHASTDGPIIMATLLVANPKKRDELVQTLEALLWAARNLAGCKGGMAAQDLDGRPRFLVYLSWDGRAALDRYTASEGFQVLLGASSVLLAEPARFRFFRFDAPDAIEPESRALVPPMAAHPHGMLPDLRTGSEIDGPLPITEFHRNSEAPGD
jgi:quinol monooxygenase YgiN